MILRKQQANFYVAPVQPGGAMKSPASTIGTLIVALMTLLLLSPTAGAQKVELNGRYTHMPRFLTASRK